MRGDALASGGRSATFGPAKVTAEKWDAIWESDTDRTSPMEPKKAESEVEDRARMEVEPLPTNLS